MIIIINGLSLASWLWGQREVAAGQTCSQQDGERAGRLERRRERGPPI